MALSWGGRDMRIIALAIVVATLCVCSVIADVSTTISDDDAKSWGVAVSIGLGVFAWNLFFGDD